MSNNYPPGVTGQEWQITGDPYEYADEMGMVWEPEDEARRVEALSNQESNLSTDFFL